jgi:nicotinate-nucleotide adenylyltransferase
MVELAVAGLFDPEATVCRAEVERPQPSFTADTVERLRVSQPGLVLRLALGSDAAAGLPGWRRVRSLLEQVQLLVYQRAGSAPAGEEVLALLRRLELPLAGAEVISLSAPAIDATGIRERLRIGDRCPDLLPMSVADYIQVHHLYQGGPDPDLVAGAG